MAVGSSYLDAYRVDRANNFYSCLRRLRDYSYDDALAASPDAAASGPPQDAMDDAPRPTPANLVAPTVHPTPANPSANPSARPLRLFMPGCSLAAYSKQMTDTVYGHLRQSGAVDGMSIACCGSVLQFAAGSKERIDYQLSLAEGINSNNVGQLVAACPGCYYSFLELVDKELCPGLEVIALPQLLTRQGMLAQAPPSQQAASPLPAAATLSDQDQAHQLPAAQALPLCPPPSVSIHDSCPDRQKGVFAESVRALFANFELREMRHNRRQSRCCGLGKLLPLRNQQVSQEMRSQRLAEFQQSGAELLVTYCLNCSQPLQGDNTYYYLELLFGIRVDWQELAVLGSEAMEVMSLSALP